MLNRTMTSKASFNGTVLKRTSSSPAPDPSKLAVLRDDDPQPHGRIYDFDAPGVSLGLLNPVNSIYRQRANFSEFALYGGKKASDDLLSFSRISIQKTAAGNVLLSDVPGDNVAGVGSTPITWDLR